MDIKKINIFWGNAYWVLGAAKLIYLLIALAQLVLGSMILFSNGQIQVLPLEIFAKIMGISEVVIAIGAMILICISDKSESKVISGHIMAIGAFLLELIVPTIILIFFGFVQCTLLIKAGIKIRENYGLSKRKQELIRNTDWFYADNDKK